MSNTFYMSCMRMLIIMRAREIVEEIVKPKMEQQTRRILKPYQTQKPNLRKRVIGRQQR